MGGHGSSGPSGRTSQPESPHRKENALRWRTQADPGGLEHRRSRARFYSPTGHLSSCSCIGLPAGKVGLVFSSYSRIPVTPFPRKASPSPQIPALPGLPCGNVPSSGKTLPGGMCLLLGTSPGVSVTFILALGGQCVGRQGLYGFKLESGSATHQLRNSSEFNGGNIPYRALRQLQG